MSNFQFWFLVTAQLVLGVGNLILAFLFQDTLINIVAGLFCILMAAYNIFTNKNRFWTRT